MKWALLVAYIALALVGFFWGKAEGTRSVSASNSVSQAIRNIVLMEEDGHLKLGYRCGGDVLAVQSWRPGSPVIRDEDFESPPRNFAFMLGGTFSSYVLTATSGGLAARIDVRRLLKAIRAPSKESSKKVITAFAIAGSGAIIGYQVGQRYGVSCDDPKLLAELKQPAIWKAAKTIIAYKLLPGIEKSLAQSFTRSPFIGRDVVTADPRELTSRSRLRMRELIIYGFPSNFSETQARTRFYARTASEKPESSAQELVAYSIMMLIALAVLALIGAMCFAIYKLAMFLRRRFIRSITASESNPEI